MEAKIVKLLLIMTITERINEIKAKLSKIKNTQ